VRVFRCRICQDPYIGTEAPSRCPFCGASKEHLIYAENWDWSQYDIEISETSKANLERALKLELDNTAFYKCARDAAQSAQDDYGYAKFKALMKVEKEHAEVITKALKINVPDIEEIKCSANYHENTQEGWDREDRAIKAYAKFAEEAPEELLKMFFNILVEIETDHLDLHAENLKK
jgi:rubrerythrin